MTEIEYLIWFVATALMTTTVLTVGTLAAADLLPHRTHARKRAASTPSEATPVRFTTAFAHSQDNQQHAA